MPSLKKKITSQESWTTALISNFAGLIFYLGDLYFSAHEKRKGGKLHGGG